MVQLGRALFWDTRVSRDGRTACASCHEAGDWSSDRRLSSIDARGKPTARHSQPVFNAMGQSSLRWIGDRANGAAQAEGSITGSMGFDKKEDVIPVLKSLDYSPAFAAAFPADADPVTPRNYGLALQAYQATLATPAPFDRFLAGDDSALDAKQREGLRAFMGAGCAACHNGPLLGGNTLQKFGLVKEYWLETKSPKIDLGRYLATKQETDKHVFRVPMLRNIAKTAPYFHDGSVDKLEDAVRIMGSVQLGRTLPESDLSAIAAFLESLSGEVPANYRTPTNLPGKDL
jgi:cytochrome c peroxidase